MHTKLKISLHNFDTFIEMKKRYLFQKKIRLEKMYQKGDILTNSQQFHSFQETLHFQKT